MWVLGSVQIVHNLPSPLLCSLLWSGSNITSLSLIVLLTTIFHTKVMTFPIILLLSISPLYSYHLPHYHHNYLSSSITISIFQAIASPSVVAEVRFWKCPRLVSNWWLRWWWEPSQSAGLQWRKVKITNGYLGHTIIGKPWGHRGGILTDIIFKYNSALTVFSANYEAR